MQSNKTFFNADQFRILDQLLIYGPEKQQIIRQTKFFIHGMSTLAIQVVKNLLLIGPQKITIYDSTIVSQADTINNKYISKQSINKLTRAQAAIIQLQKLNLQTKLDTSASQLSILQISSNYNCVVIIDCLNKQYLHQLNISCRNNKVGFIYGGCLGLYGYTFVDFGDQFKVDNQNGEAPKYFIVGGIENSERGIVTISGQYNQEKGHDFQDGQFVTFNNVQGMLEVNDKQFRIEVIDKRQFCIGDTTKYSKYTGGGAAIQCIKPKIFSHKPLQQTLNTINCQQIPFNFDFQKQNRTKQLHLILAALLDYCVLHPNIQQKLKTSQLIKYQNEEMVKQIFQQCLKSLQRQKQQKNNQINMNIDDKLIRNRINYIGIQIAPLCLFWGGIIAQQAIKIIGYFAPLKQWLHYDIYQLIQQQKQQPHQTQINFEMQQQNKIKDKYQILFGKQFVNNLQKCQTLIIGAGAPSNQIVKMFAQMGISTTQNTKSYCTDPNKISSNNINQHQLFNSHHIGKYKSQVLSSQAKQINNKFNIQSIPLSINNKTQDKFNDQFWKPIDFVICTTDNNKTKQYIDNQCVWYQKPLLHISTDGIKCNTNVVIPHCSQTLNDFQSINNNKFMWYDMSTVKNFPFRIQHVLQMAQVYFQQNFQSISQKLHKLYTNKQQFLQQLNKQYRNNQHYLLQTLQKMKQIIEINKSKEYKKCLEKAIKIFYQCFYNCIQRLLFVFPANHFVQQTGQMFWTGNKRVPKMIDLDIYNNLHIEFIQATANILAKMLNIAPQAKIHQIQQQINKIKYINPKQKLHRHSSNPTKQQQQQINREQSQMNNNIKELVYFLQNLEISENQTNNINVISFQVCEANNSHFQFIYSASMIRANNYRIKNIDRLKVKSYIGKIIPKTITTISTGVGALGIQVIKLILDKNTKKYKNFICNQSMPIYMLNQLLPAKKKIQKQFDPIMMGPIKPIPTQFTKWLKISIKGPMTLGQLKDKIQNDYHVSIDIIIYGSTALYTSFGRKTHPSLQLNVVDVIGKPLAAGRSAIKLCVAGSTHEGIDFEMPDIRYFI